MSSTRPTSDLTVSRDSDSLSDRLAEHRDRAEVYLAERDERLSGLHDWLLVELESVAEKLSAWDELSEALGQETSKKNRLEADYRSARDALLASRSEEKELRQELAKSKKVLNERGQQVRQLREQLEAALAQSEESVGMAEELVRVQSERDQLQERLTELTVQLNEAPGTDSADYEDLRRQFEMAVETIRSLKERNQQLETQLTEAGQESQDSPTAFDWETQKARMFQEMNDDAELSSDDRCTIEETLRVTEKIVQEKEREVESLRSQLEQAREQAVPAAADAGAGDEALDADERIQQERERLRKLQEEWREKMRAAEVEFAVERAENGRQCAALDEKMRELESQARMLEKLDKSRGAAKWRDHLGLGALNPKKNK